MNDPEILGGCCSLSEAGSASLSALMLRAELGSEGAAAGPGPAGSSGGGRVGDVGAALSGPRSGAALSGPRSGTALHFPPLPTRWSCSNRFPHFGGAGPARRWA